ncbi:MlaA family lipoprotein [Candidatus Magnetobacterium casense]|uniref:VacJ family lipoprotein n=1 Tax=Candidatus Magnetobacterium casense TaxID=1455061 RepID=A0ABS6S231_9BACT|nr:VacJ family lipoprotein [Candidatus Magnetobacterium casensis]MBV6342912.1 VacJ family lipoprotein [Candidatus Magnetobacterium casensis]
MFNRLRVRNFCLLVVVNVVLLFTIEAFYGDVKAWGEDYMKKPVVADNGSGNNSEATDNTIADPFEVTNRIMFEFNDKVYFWLIRPLSGPYNAFIDEPERGLISNFFHNLLTPIRFVSSLLQLKLEDAGIELARFGINTTLGVFGLGDVAAANFNLEANRKDIGQTLGSYGIGHGFYIVWPFLGPMTLRDSFGYAGDQALSPISYVGSLEGSLSLNVYRYFNKTSLQIGDYEDLKTSAVDPYIALRDAYIQYRNNLVRQESK